MDHVSHCLPPAYHEVFQKIVAVESGGNPYAVNVNGRQRLARQPKSKEEAIAWSSWLIQRGYSVDMGLGQVNSQHLRPNGLAKDVDLEAIFTPCPNLSIAATIFGKNYQTYGNITAALSAYNTGSPTRGISNGYVAKVLNAKGVNWQKWGALSNEIYVTAAKQEQIEPKKPIQVARTNPFLPVVEQENEISIQYPNKPPALIANLVSDNKLTPIEAKKQLMQEDMSVTINKSAKKEKNQSVAISNGLSAL